MSNTSSPDAINIKKYFINLENLEPQYRVLEVFSRFEYALKEAGFAAMHNRGYILIQRKDFSSQLRDPVGTEIPQIFKIKPPASQQIIDGRLKWDSYPRPLHDGVTFEVLLNTAYDVRHNLFHGGKADKKEHDTSRDRALLEAAIAVVKTALELAEKHSVKQVRDVHLWFADSL